MKLANGKCNGVPFFINTDTGDFVCGASSCDRLKTLVGVQ